MRFEGTLTFFEGLSPYARFPEAFRIIHNMLPTRNCNHSPSHFTSLPLFSGPKLFSESIPFNNTSSTVVSTHISITLSTVVPTGMTFGYAFTGQM